MIVTSCRHEKVTKCCSRRIIVASLGRVDVDLWMHGACALGSTEGLVGIEGERKNWGNDQQFIRLRKGTVVTERETNMTKGEDQAWIVAMMIEEDPPIW